MNAKSNAGVGGHRLERLPGGPDQDLDPVGDAGLLEVALRDRGALLVELEAGQPAASASPRAMQIAL